MSPPPPLNLYPLKAPTMNLFRRPTLSQLSARKLEEARRRLQEAQEAHSYALAMIAHYERQINHLNGVIPFPKINPA